MPPIKEDYSLDKRNITIPSVDSLKKSVEFKKPEEALHTEIVLPIEINSIPVSLDILAIKIAENEYKIAITACLDQIAVGYMDFYISDYDQGFISGRGGGNFLQRNIIESNLDLITNEMFPERSVSIRQHEDLNNVNSLNVLPEYRKKNIGATLLFTCFEICKLLNVDIFFINDTSYPSYKPDHHLRSYYAQFITIIPYTGTVIFPISDKAIKSYAAQGLKIKES